MTKNLTLKQRRTLGYLLTSKDIAQAAKAAGVSRDTVYRWLREPVFRTALETITNDSLENLTRRMVGLGDKAADTLEDALKSDFRLPGARVQAAKAIIAAIPQLRELFDLEGRVAELEKAVKK